MILSLWTDGSSGAKNGTTGGWAFAAVNSETNELCFHDSGYHLSTSNNRMEITAVISAIEETRRRRTIHPIIERIDILSDSAYVVNCIVEGWYKGWRQNGWYNSSGDKVANQDLWEQLLSHYEGVRCPILFKHVKGHSGIEWNEFVDKQAKAARKIAKGILERGE